MINTVANFSFETESSLIDELRETHLAKNQAFSFVPIESMWTLDVQNTSVFDLSCVHSSTSEFKYYYLKVLAHFATKVSINTFRSYFFLLKRIDFTSDINEFKQFYGRLEESYKLNIRPIFTKANELFPHVFEPFNKFLNSNKVKKRDSNFLDPNKGAYSDEENASISYALRLATDKITSEFKGNKSVQTPSKINSLGVLLGHHLMRGILRRPTQLVKMKWSDVLPVGVSFNDLLSSPVISDKEALHVRIFKGKRGDFRGYAEKRSIRLEAELSNLVRLYYYQYMKAFVETLSKQNINLNKDELREIKGRLPFFYDLSLFSTNFQDKNNLFKSLSMKSSAFHKTDTNLNSLLQGFDKSYLSPHLKSERIESYKLKVNNNRIRHTALTNGARKNMPSEALAAITGVTMGAVTPYVDLTNDARAEIDNALANNHILNNFGRISVVELQSEPGYIQLNEFEEEIGVIESPNDCSSCKSNLGKPLACYPCSNFKPLAEADHQYYLDKAERKLLLNSGEGINPLATRKLREIVLYIKATMAACKEWKFKRLESTR